MRLTVLGRDGGFPTPRGACSGYLVESETTAVVCDLGTGTLANLLALRSLSEIDALILTHLHFDHCSDALVLRYALEKAVAAGARGPLPLYLPGTPEAHRALFEYPEAFEPHTLKTGLAVRIGDLKADFLAVRHPVETYAVRLTAPDGKTLVYTGDTGYFQGLEPFASGADALLADTAFLIADGRPNAPHMTTGEASQLAAAAQTGHLYCSHLSGGELIAKQMLEEVDFTPKTVVKMMGQYDI